MANGDEDGPGVGAQEIRQEFDNSGSNRLEYSIFMVGLAVVERLDLILIELRGGGGGGGGGHGCCCHHHHHEHHHHGDGE